MILDCRKIEVIMILEIFVHQ